MWYTRWHNVERHGGVNDVISCDFRRHQSLSLSSTSYIVKWIMANDSEMWSTLKKLKLRRKQEKYLLKETASPRAEWHCVWRKRHRFPYSNKEDSVGAQRIPWVVGRLRIIHSARFSRARCNQADCCSVLQKGMKQNINYFRVGSARREGAARSWFFCPYGPYVVPIESFVAQVSLIFVIFCSPNLL